MQQLVYIFIYFLLLLILLFKPLTIYKNKSKIELFLIVILSISFIIRKGNYLLTGQIGRLLPFYICTIAVYSIYLFLIFKKDILLSIGYFFSICSLFTLIDLNPTYGWNLNNIYMYSSIIDHLIAMCFPLYAIRFYNYKPNKKHLKYIFNSFILSCFLVLPIYKFTNYEYNYYELNSKHLLSEIDFFNNNQMYANISYIIFMLLIYKIILLPLSNVIFYCINNKKNVF